MQYSFPIKILLVVAFLCYPFLMLFGLSHWGITPIALVLMVAAFLKLLVSKNSQLKPLYVLGILCGLLSLLRQDEMWVKFYPACMNVGWLLVFAWSLRTDQSMVERIARTHEPDLPPSGVAWTRKVTYVWCGFFLFNATVSAYTALYASLATWTWYNGFVSYVLMGCLFTGEFVLRHFHKARLAKI